MLEYVPVLLQGRAPRPAADELPGLRDDQRRRRCHRLPIERGRPGPALLAHVLIAKYCDHLPLHRQSVIYARAGVELDRSTLADWVGSAVFLLLALAEAIGRHPGPAPFMRTTRRCRCSTPGEARPRRAACGWSARRAALGIDRAAGGLLSLLGRSQGRARRGAAGAVRGFLHADAYAGFG